MKKVFFIVSVFCLFAVLGMGCVNKQDILIQEQQKKIVELSNQVETLKSTIITASTSVSSNSTSTLTPIVQEVGKKEVIVSSTVKNAVSNTIKNSTGTDLKLQKINSDLESILINYKVDAQDGKSLREALLNASVSSPDKLCPNIIAERTTKKNIYYLVINQLNDLEAQYGQYKEKIVYIGNNLPGLWAAIEIVKDKCESIGFNI